MCLGCRYFSSVIRQELVGSFVNDVPDRGELGRGGIDHPGPPLEDPRGLPDRDLHPHIENEKLEVVGEFRCPKDLSEPVQIGVSGIDFVCLVIAHRPVEELHDLRRGRFNLGGGSAESRSAAKGDDRDDHRMNCRQPAMGPMALLGFESLLSHG